MKTSNAILIGVGSTLAAIVVVGIIVARFVLNGVTSVPIGDVGGSGTLSGTETTRAFDLSDFTGISAHGAWDVKLTRSTAYSIEVSTSQAMANRLDVRVRGETLQLGIKPGTSIGNQRLVAAISMPALDSIELSGANRATVSGFKGERLDVRCSGAASVTGSEGSYRTLKVVASGASSVAFRRLPVDTAEVDLSGAGQAELQMNGGELSGRLSGAAKVTYWGTVSKQEIHTSGIGSVVHR